MVPFSSFFVLDPSTHHQRLRSQYFAIIPPPDMHIRTLVPDGDELLVQTPSLQQLEGILAQPETVSKPHEFAHFFKNQDLESLVVHGHGTCEASQSGADDNDPKAAVIIVGKFTFIYRHDYRVREE
jgi:hypothetical protein